MEYFTERIWSRLRSSLAGRLLAAALIAAAFGAVAGEEVSHTAPAIILSGGGGALLGVFAVGLLEWRDRRRNRSAQWQQRINVTGEQIRREYPALPPEHLPAAAQAVEERRLTPLVWCGMILGGLSLLGGAVGIVFSVVQFLRELVN